MMGRGAKEEHRALTVGTPSDQEMEFSSRAPPGGRSLPASGIYVENGNLG
jgi:hypothetical protein